MEEDLERVIRLEVKGNQPQRWNGDGEAAVKQPFSASFCTVVLWKDVLKVN